MPELTPPDPPLSRGRVLIRPPRSNDAEAIIVVANDPDVIRQTRIPVPYGPEQASAFIESARREWEENTAAIFVGIDLHDGGFLGTCGVHLDVRENVGDVGYMVAPDKRGAGVATSMAWLACQFGFDVGLARITIHSSVDNEASNRLAERLGFTREGVLRSGHIDGPAGDVKAPRVDLNMWGLLAGELTEPKEPTE